MIEIRCGNLGGKLELVEVYIDYLRIPKKLELTTEQLDLIEDTTDSLEFPDYVCYEIINELVKLILEQASDPRLNTNPNINMTVIPPVQ